MKRIIALALLFVVLGYIHGQDKNQSIVKVDNELYIDDHGEKYALCPDYVSVKPITPLENLASKYKIGHVGELGFVDLRVPDGVDIKEYVETLKMCGDFETVEYIGEVKCHFTPNDSLFIHQNPIDRLNFKNVWDITKGNPNVKVAIIDTGVLRDHPDLGYGNDGYSNISYSLGYDYFAGTTYQTPTEDHGTLVAGVIGAKMHNNHKGIAGVSGGNNSQGVTLISYHAINTSQGSASASNIASAMVKAVDQGAKVINISCGTSHLTAIDNAIDYADNHGVTIICSSGNEGNSYLSYPASHYKTIAVGGNNPYGGNYNYGTGMDIVAPAETTFTTDYHIGYATFNATSLSAAITSGTVALMLSVNSTLSPSQIRSILRNTAKKLTGYSYNSSGWNQYVGYGELDPLAAVLFACNTAFPKTSVICPTSSTYTINNIPSNLYVTWRYLGDDNSTYPPFTMTTSGNSCTVYNSSSLSFFGTIMADIMYGSNVLTTLKKRVRGVSSLSGTCHQQGGYYHYQNYQSFTRPLNSNLRVNQMCTITLQSPKFKDMNISISQGGGYVESFSHDGNETITFVAAYSNTDRQFVISGVGNGGPCNNFSITITTTKTPIQPLTISMLTSMDDGCLEVGLKRLAIDNGSQLDSRTYNEATEIGTWTLEVYNATTGEKVFGKEIEGTSFTIDTTGWRPGVYVVKAIIGDEVLTEKVIVK